MIAQPLNAGVLASLPGACSLSTEGANGPDRITRHVYDAAGRLSQVQSAYGTAAQQNTVTQTYTANSQLATLTDANGNVTTYEYDGLDRLRRIRFPNASGGGSSSTDYEQFAYNDNSLVTQQRLRDGGEINFTYDNLSRVTAIDAPSGTPDIANAYDNFSRLTQTAFTGTHTLSFAYDQLSRNTSATRVADGATQVVSYQYDLAGRRTRVTWPDSFYAQYDYDLTGAVTAIRENGASSGVGVLAAYAYDNLGRRTSVTRGNGVTTTYSYDAASRLSQLSQNLSGTSDDLTLGFSYNSAGQAVSRTGMTGAYAWPQPSINAEMYTANGRNQYASVGGANFTYDARGNLTATGSASYGYDAFNRLTSAGAASLSYDPAGRLYQVSASPNTTRFLYDGLDAIAEYNGSNTMLRRYVHGPSFDEPVVWYEGSGTSDRRWLVADQLGSVVAATDSDGDLIGAPNTYDEYGRPGPSNTGRFQYTGQMWLEEAGVYHYRARIYDPAIGRFLQTDPIGYASEMNLYAYVRGDPINFTDPLGLQEVDEEEIVVNAPSCWPNCGDPLDLFRGDDGVNTGWNGERIEMFELAARSEEDEIVVTATPRSNCGSYLAVGASPRFFGFGSVDGGVILSARYGPLQEPFRPDTQEPWRFGPGNQSTSGPVQARTRGPILPSSTGRATGARGGAILPPTASIAVTIVVTSGHLEERYNVEVTAGAIGPRARVRVRTIAGTATITARLATYSTGEGSLQVCWD